MLRRNYSNYSVVSVLDLDVSLMAAVLGLIEISLVTLKIYSVRDNN